MRRKKGVTFRRKLIMFPLMDVFFVLLMFYLVIPQSSWRRAELLSLPETAEMGRANALVQMKLDGGFLWFDSTAIETYLGITDSNFRALSAQEKQRFLRSSSILVRDESDLNRRITALKNTLRASKIPNYTVLVRCPDELPFSAAKQTVDVIMGTAADSTARDSTIGLYILGGSDADLDFSVDVVTGRNVLGITYR